MSHCHKYSLLNFVRVYIVPDKLKLAMAYSRKKQHRGRGRLKVDIPPPPLLKLLLFYLWKFQTKESWKFHKSLSPFLKKFQVSPRKPKTKTPLLGNSTLFFLGQPVGSSTSLLISIRQFFWYPWKFPFHILNTPNP